MEPKLMIVMLLKCCHIVQGKKQMLSAGWCNFCQLNSCKGDGLFEMLYPGNYLEFEYLPLGSKYTTVVW